MIPKIIHYCWFGKGLMPKSQKDCIKGWKKLMPDYQFMRWDESTFDYRKYKASKYAYEVKKYALVSDVCRYNVLAEYGGIYLDTDVEVFQRFDRFLDCNFFSGIERYYEFEAEHIAERYLNPDGTALRPDEDVPRLEILTSTMACCKDNDMICRIRDYYNAIESDADWALHYRDHVNNDRLVARYLVQYGFRYRDETQRLEGDKVVYGTGTFGYAFSPNHDYTVSFHHNASTWEREKWSKTQRISYLFDTVGLLPVYKRYKNLKKRVKKRLLHPVVGEVWCLHRVVETRSPYPSNRSLEITPDYLEQLIQAKKDEGYKFVSLDELLASHGRMGARKRINISFDDGFKDVYTTAFPILKKHKVPFTLYLTTGFLDGTADVWWLGMEQLGYDVATFEKITGDVFAAPGKLSETMHSMTGFNGAYADVDRALLSWKQVEEMLSSGLCTMGSHGVTHNAFSRMTAEERIQELRDSKSMLEQRLGVTVSHFSYPHSMTDAKMPSALRDAGYSTAALGYGGRLRKGYDPFLLPRVTIVQPGIEH